MDVLLMHSVTTTSIRKVGVLLCLCKHIARNDTKPGSSLNFNTRKKNALTKSERD